MLTRERSFKEKWGQPAKAHINYEINNSICIYGDFDKDATFPSAKISSIAMDRHKNRPQYATQKCIPIAHNLFNSRTAAEWYPKVQFENANVREMYGSERWLNR